jgi:hypothetical protein
MIEGLLVGAAVYVAGLLTGRFLPARKHGPQPVRPVCGCEHAVAYHDPKTGECHARRNLGYWSGKDHFEGCTCRRYTGPEPLPEYYAPEIPS